MNKTIGQEYRSLVAKVSGNGTFENSYGLFYKFEYEMEDGTVLSANHKSKDGNFPQGTEVEYVIRGTNDYGAWGKVSKPFDGDRGNGTPYSQENNGLDNPPGNSDNNKHKSIIWQSLAKVAATLYSRHNYNPDEAVRLTDFLVSYHDWVIAGKQGEKPVFDKSRVAEAENLPF